MTGIFHHYITKLRTVKALGSLCCPSCLGITPSPCRPQFSPFSSCALFPHPSCPGHPKQGWHRDVTTRWQFPGTAKGMFLCRAEWEAGTARALSPGWGHRDEVQCQVKQAAVSISSQLSGFKDYLEQRPWIFLSQGFWITSSLLLTGLVAQQE